MKAETREFIGEILDGDLPLPKNRGWHHLFGHHIIEYIFFLELLLVLSRQDWVYRLDILRLNVSSLSQRAASRLGGTSESVNYHPSFARQFVTKIYSSDALLVTPKHEAIFC